MILKPANILSIFLACLYIYGGSGFYLATFCCGDCEAKGIEIVLSEGCHNDDNGNKDAENSCCPNAQSEQERPASNSLICGDQCNHAAHCSVESYRFDLDNFVQKIRYTIAVVDLLFEPYDFVIAQKSYAHFPNLFLDDPYPLLSSRDILLNDSVLLI